MRGGAHLAPDPRPAGVGRRGRFRDVASGLRHFSTFFFTSKINISPSSIPITVRIVDGIVILNRRSTSTMNECSSGIDAPL